MASLPVIPTPPRLVWREIRHRAFPGLVFVVALAAAVALWQEQAGVSQLVGEVESVTSSVITVEDGILTELHVDRFQPVTAGQAIAEFRVADPEAVKLKLASITAELKVMETRLAQDQQRILQDFEQLRLSWLRERVALATARVDLQFSESELTRVTKLFDDKLVSEDQFDLAKSVAESRRAEVAEREKLVEEIKASLDRLSPDDGGRFNSSMAEKLNQEIAAEEERLKLSSRPVTLRAPIGGVVTVVFHQAGERVARGGTIVAITQTTPQRIVAFLRSPNGAPPRAGDSVEVRSRLNRHQIGFGKVLRVGRHFEPISTNVAAANPGSFRLGLPVLVSLPDNMSLLPGEIVDLALKSE